MGLPATWTRTRLAYAFFCVDEANDAAEGLKRGFMMPLTMRLLRIW